MSKPGPGSATPRRPSSRAVFPDTTAQATRWSWSALRSMAADWTSPSKPTVATRPLSITGRTDTWLWSHPGEDHEVVDSEQPEESALVAREGAGDGREVAG